MSDSRQTSVRRDTSWHADAQRLKADGLGVAEIGRRLGRTASAVSKALNPERAREYRRHDDAQPGRREYKTAWERTEQGRAMRREVRDRHRASCVDCGSLLMAGSEWMDIARCVECEKVRRAEGREIRLSLIHGMYEDGWSYAEMSSTMGWARSQVVCHYLVALRRRGVIGHRNRVAAAA